MITSGNGYLPHYSSVIEDSLRNLGLYIKTCNRSFRRTGSVPHFGVYTTFIENEEMDDGSEGCLKYIICSFIQQIFIMHLLCGKHCSKHWWLMIQQWKKTVLTEVIFGWQMCLLKLQVLTGLTHLWKPELSVKQWWFPSLYHKRSYRSFLNGPMWYPNHSILSARMER